MSCYLPYERKDRRASARREWATCCARRLQTLPLPTQVGQSPGSSTMPGTEKYLDLVVKPLLPGWARLFVFPMILCAEPKSLQSLSITNPLERVRVGGSPVTIDLLTDTAAILN